MRVFATLHFLKDEHENSFVNPKHLNGLSTIRAGIYMLFPDRSNVFSLVESNRSLKLYMIFPVTSFLGQFGHISQDLSFVDSVYVAH